MSNDKPATSRRIDEMIDGLTILAKYDVADTSAFVHDELRVWLREQVTQEDAQALGAAGWYPGNEHVNGPNMWKCYP